MKHYLALALASVACFNIAEAAKVKVVMNTTSTTMSLVEKTTGNAVEVGEPSTRTYTFDADAGTYVLTGYASNGTTVNGTIEINVTDSEDEQTFTVLSPMTYATNKDWVYGTDYTINAVLSSKEGNRRVITLGDDTTEGRKRFLALNGDTYMLYFTPSESHKAEGYMESFKTGTLTNSVTISNAITMGADYTVTVPADAEFTLGYKTSHYVKFTEVEPINVEDAGDVKKLTYYLASGQEYNYRTWKEGELTNAGYFTMNTDEAKRPTLVFTDADYAAKDPKAYYHEYTANNGYETGNILVNVNERGHLQLNVGDEFTAHAMRSWQLVDNITHNYFIEPDFHYTVIDVNGNPSTNVITIDNADTTTNPWSKIKAVGKGTAIVLVTYDGIDLNLYNTSAVKTAFYGGEYWGAIWPENTAAYVVTVGESASSVVPNMTINKGLNDAKAKLAGDNVDAEHDVFYYLDGEEGAKYTFTPEGAAKIEIAYPVIGEQMATYKGFGSEGVTDNGDGSYTLLLKHGRQIVRLTDANGNSTYQVLTAKSCTMEIVNADREGSKIFQPGDNVKIQFSGLSHPANKLSAIYNMTAKVVYQDIPEGITAKTTGNQYLFGSTATAQAVTFTIPKNIDLTANDELVFKNGTINVGGLGSSYGKHRELGETTGCNANFTATSVGAYFGMLPDATIKVTAEKTFTIKLTNDVAGVNYTVALNGNTIAANEDGTYTGTYGNYTVEAGKAGYRGFHGTFNIADDAEGEQIFDIELTAAEAAGTWDGTTLTEPQVVDDVYQISNGAELAWFANKVNTDKVYDAKAELVDDIDLGDYTWTPIGTSNSIYYSGTFNGNNHDVKGIYINDVTKSYLGLFGYIKGGTVKGTNVYGLVRGKQYVGGIAGYTNADTGVGATIDRCANFATVYSASTYAGGITGYMAGSLTNLSNCYNVGDITGVTSNVGGVVGYISTIGSITNIYNIGEVSGPATSTCACVGSTQAKTKVSNAYSTKEYTLNTDCTLVTEEQMASGEIAYKLGEAFGQEIGVDAYPVFGGMKVFYNETTDTYTNDEQSGVENIATDNAATPVGYYDLQGRRLSKPQRGLNIVVMSDGSVVKQRLQ
jgi:hypothetical protein